jgi:hypothetical protein
LQIIFEDKQKELETVKLACDDEAQIKNVLMMRIKELEARQDSKRTESYDFAS